MQAAAKSTLEGLVEERVASLVREAATVQRHIKRLKTGSILDRINDHHHSSHATSSQTRASCSGISRGGSGSSLGTLLNSLVFSCKAICEQLSNRNTGERLFVSIDIW
eukprot:scaffold218318_cov59-Attheya_sp.AAC.2